MNFWFGVLVLGSTVLIMAVIKIYMKLGSKRNGSYTCLIGKTAIITGANAGIGYITALDFAMRGARVILACRNKDKAEDAKRRIIKATGNQNVEYRILDLESLVSVRTFTEEINKSESRLDILVNNAGHGFARNDFSTDGLPTIMQTNHLSPFLLTHLLIGKLKASAPSRIVNVSSIGAKWASLDIDKIMEVQKTSYAMISSSLYNDTKLCNILFTIELAKKLDGTGVTVNALHPGAINTEFQSKILKDITKTILTFILSFFFLTPEEGAQTQIYVSVSKDIEGVSGEFFSNCQRTEFYETAKNPDLARKLWIKSEELVKITDSEKL